MKLTVAPLRGYPSRLTCAYSGSFPPLATCVAFFAESVIEEFVDIRGSMCAV